MCVKSYVLIIFAHTHELTDQQHELERWVELVKCLLDSIINSPLHLR